MMKKEIEMTAPKTVLVGDRVRYESAAGTIRGEVVAIVDRMCADNVVRPWIGVQHHLNGRDTVTYLSDASLAMMKFVVTFRDINIQIALGDRNSDGSFFQAA
jgi:hypothetical protein